MLNIKLLDILKNIDLIYYVFVLCIFNIGLSIYLFIQMKKTSKLSRNEMYIGFSQPNNEELTGIKNEHRKLLEILIQKDNLSEYRKNLLEKFLHEFPQKNNLDFSINLKEMQRLGYITQGPFNDGFVVTITDRACEKLSHVNQ